MSLSEDEKSRLDEIAAHVMATDPDFALRLRAAGARHPSTLPGPASDSAPAGHPSGGSDPRPGPAGDPVRRQNRLLTLLCCLLFVGISLLSNGVTAAQGLISLGALVATAGAVLTGWSAVQLVRFDRARRARPA